MELRGSATVHIGAISKFIENKKIKFSDCIYTT